MGQCRQKYPCLVLLLFFFLMTWRPPRSYLFPYTTLFRSDRKSTRLNSSHIFFFNDPPPTEIYTLSLHDALPISSSAYSVRFPIRHATVVSRLFLDAIGFVPVFMSMKQPVPYVFFTMPGWVHAWPNSAACWSPAIPAIGTRPPNSVVSPYTSLDEPTCGSTERGTPNSFSSSSSQSPVRRLNSIVRDALLGSVTCTRPPVRFHTSHESTVPKASLPAFARARAPGTLRRIHSSLGPEKYASTA